MPLLKHRRSRHVSEDPPGLTRKLPESAKSKDAGIQSLESMMTLRARQGKRSRQSLLPLHAHEAKLIQGENGGDDLDLSSNKGAIVDGKSQLKKTTTYLLNEILNRNPTTIKKRRTFRTRPIRSPVIMIVTKIMTT